MAETEKMVELKKAYAEMILNTAKEAARRVMASEKLAIRCQHDLFSTKDEALRLLVRLKQMFDSKMIEAEIASSSQQTKIDELELQLQEAEGVIIDLREDLKCAREKLENARSNKVQPCNGKPTRDDECIYQNDCNMPSSDGGLQPVATSDTKNALFNNIILDNKYSNTEQTEILNVPQFKNHPSGEAKLASIIIRNKEPELYRNRFTQRIRALERNFLAGKLSPSREVDEYSVLKSELITKESNKDDIKFTVPSPKNNNLGTAKSTFGEEVKKHVKVRTLRRTRYGRSKAKRRSHPSELLKSYQPPSILSRCKRLLVSENSKTDKFSFALSSIKTDNMDVKKNLNTLEEEVQSQSGCFMDENIISHEGKRQKKVQHTDPMSMPLTSCSEGHESYEPSSALSHRKACSFSLCEKTKSGEDMLKTNENEVKLKTLPCPDPGLTLIKSGRDPLSGFPNVKLSVKALNRCDVARNTTNKNMGLVDEEGNQKCETAVSSASSTFSCYEPDAEVVNVPLIYSDPGDLESSQDAMVDVSVLHSDSKDAKASSELKESLSQVNNNRLLKYTFQRKRKKEALSSPDQNVSIEKSTVKRRAGQEQNDSSELQKSSMINESTRDRRRLAQVACQLISLSGKRW